MTHFEGEQFCGGKRLGAIQVWLIYCKLLEDFQKVRNFKFPNPRLKVKKVARGAAHYGTEPFIVIPTRALSKCREWVIYYIAHELAHHAHGHLDHGIDLCKVEGELLRPFNILIEYKSGRHTRRAVQCWYPRRLLRISTGEIICWEKGKSLPPAKKRNIVPT